MWASRYAWRANVVKDGPVRLGLDLGGTQIKAVVLAEDHRVLWSLQIDTFAAEGRDAVLDRMVQLVATASAAVAPPPSSRWGSPFQVSSTWRPGGLNCSRTSLPIGTGSACRALWRPGPAYRYRC